MKIIIILNLKVEIKIQKAELKNRKNLVKIYSRPLLKIAQLIREPQNKSKRTIAAFPNAEVASQRVKSKRLLAHTLTWPFLGHFLQRCKIKKCTFFSELLKKRFYEFSITSHF